MVWGQTIRERGEPVAGSYTVLVPIFGGASRAAVLELRCPHCGVVQARAREKEGTSYRCRECHREFTREEGLAKAAGAKAAEAASAVNRRR
jgi:DNA-directed RNA polymerase subunit RPC12/RpoP